LRAKSKARACERYLSIDECRRLLAQFSGRDHLIVRLAIQLGLKPEELFALRRDDVQDNFLRVDEALVEGKSAAVKTNESYAFLYMPPEVALELSLWMQSNPGAPRDWIFQTTHGRPGYLNANNFRKRVLQPAAIRAGIGVRDSGKKDAKGKPILKTDVDFRALRRTCAMLFGARAKDPKLTQTQLRHADPTITLKHYQKSMPQEVRDAGDRLEHDLALGVPSAAPTLQ
jgi:integrase